MKDRICLVTGANVGIGLETARGLAQQGATVVLACRSRTKAEAAAEDIRSTVAGANVELIDLDLASLDSVRAAAAAFLANHDRLDVLVNNAGLILTDRRETAEGFEMQLGVNHLGHFLLTHLLLDALKAAGSARVVNLSSMGHQMSRGLDFDDLMYTRRTYRDVAVYGDSKLANILFTRELARRVEGTGIVAHAVHPGAVATSFGGDGDAKGWFGLVLKGFGWAFATPAKGARTSLHVATSDDAGRSTGEYWASRKRKRPSKQARDDAAARRLWEVSEQLVGITG